MLLLLIPDSVFSTGISIENFLSDHQQENWVWDQFSRSPDVELSPDLLNAYFHIDPVFNSRGTAGGL